jgi:Fur family transcriptional regulator, peroxide stress response regulator
METELEAGMDAFKAACREAGLKLTHQRLEIFRELSTARDHPTAEVLYRRIQKRISTISLDTIYRTLANLEAHGLINRVLTMENQAHFEVKHEQHHHITCADCGEIMDFDWKTFDNSPLPEEISKWGTVKDRRVTLHGVCDKCIKGMRDE